MAMGQAAAPAAIAQASAAPKVVAPARQLAFDVVSIRLSKQNPAGESANWGIEPDGYRTSNQTLWTTIMIAYFPQGLANWTPDRLKGAPSWLSSEQYDINAKVAASDLPEWHKQGATLEHEDMFRAMLQSMLADRCKLVVHRIPAEVPGLALVVGKSGPQFKSFSPDEAVPSGGSPIPGGGAIINQDQGRTIRFYGITMDRLVQYMSTFSYPRLPIQDQTGLMGKYDLVLRRPDPLPAGAGDDDSNSTRSWDVESIGLQLKPIKIATDTLVIDHIERPTEN
jgi:uncharacterized protein (TIGR03435 family)